MGHDYDLTKIRSQLGEEVLTYLAQIAARAAGVPLYYPAHLRSLERGGTRFDEIRQTVQVVQDREVFQKWLAEHRERQRAAGYPIGSQPYAPRAECPGDPQDEGSMGRELERTRPMPISWDEKAGQWFRRAVILGDPGLGKTWLLRYEARRIASASSALLEEGSIPLEQMEFPIHLRLSDLNRTKRTQENTAPSPSNFRLIKARKLSE